MTRANLFYEKNFEFFWFEIFWFFLWKKLWPSIKAKSKALVGVFSPDTDDDDEYEPIEKKTRKSSTPKTPYKGKYDKELDKLTDQQCKLLQGNRIIMSFHEQVG